LPAAQRFYALAAAAKIMRTNGMELIGTELEPDWHIHEGNFEIGIAAKSRHDELVPASADELSRAAQNDVVPETRWHYRAQAAALKVEAAKLGWVAAAQLPDNSEAAAQILGRSGSWLDAKSAAKYYQAILHHCRNTEIGAETARIGDFPKLDENGRVIRRQLNAEDQPVPGKAYVIHAGDTLTQIAALASATGQRITVADILQANRNLLPDKIRAGRTINIPIPGARENNSMPQEDPSIETTSPIAGNESTTTGERYVIQSGDSLARIAQAVSTFGGQVSVQDILDANPGLLVNRLKVGQVILIPMPPDQASH
jgi:LysM repeat protein